MPGLALAILLALAPLVPAPLAWDMDKDRAMKALERAGMSPRYAETRGYFAPRAGEPVEHTTEPVIYFVPRAGWTGEARFAWSDKERAHRLGSVSVEARLGATAMRQEIAALVARLGAPTRKLAAEHLWIRGGVWLVAASGPLDPKTGLGWFRVVHRRDDRPAP